LARKVWHILNLRVFLMQGKDVVVGTITREDLDVMKSYMLSLCWASDFICRAIFVVVLVKFVFLALQLTNWCSFHPSLALFCTRSPFLFILLYLIASLISTID
jgi:hypothetical protein